jgi:hypothetical protein
MLVHTGRAVGHIPCVNPIRVKFVRSQQCSVSKKDPLHCLNCPVVFSRRVLASGTCKGLEKSLG